MIPDFSKLIALEAPSAITLLIDEVDSRFLRLLGLMEDETGLMLR